MKFLGGCSLIVNVILVIALIAGAVWFLRPAVSVGFDTAPRDQAPAQVAASQAAPEPTQVPAARPAPEKMAAADPVARGGSIGEASPQLDGGGPTPTPTKELVVAGAPAGKIWAWHGRWAPECETGYELIVEFDASLASPPEGVSLQFGADLPDGCQNEFGNDSLKGLDPEGTWWDAMSSFPTASLLIGSFGQGFMVCEDDLQSCGGRTWTLPNGDPPEEFHWLVENAHKVSLTTYWWMQEGDHRGPEAPFRVIRWIRSADAPAWVTD